VNGFRPSSSTGRGGQFSARRTPTSTISLIRRAGASSPPRDRKIHRFLDGVGDEQHGAG
jgi:hypothetical protein